MSQQSPASSRSSRSSAKSKAPPADPYGFLSLTLTPDTETADHALDATSCVIGRAPQANLRINLPHISASHCVVRQEGSRVMLMDVSTNGTFVNGDVVGKSLEVELREIGADVLFAVKGLGEALDADRGDAVVRQVQLLQDGAVGLCQPLRQPSLLLG